MRCSPLVCHTFIAPWSHLLRLLFQESGGFLESECMPAGRARMVGSPWCLVKHPGLRGTLFLLLLFCFCFCFLWFLRHGLMYSRLASYSLHSQRWLDFWSFCLHLQSGSNHKHVALCLLSSLLEIKSKALCMLGKHFTAKSQSHPGPGRSHASLSFFKGIRSFLLTQVVFPTLPLLSSFLPTPVSKNLKSFFLI